MAVSPPTSPEQSREFAIRSQKGARDTALTQEQKDFVAEVRKRAQVDTRSAAERMKQGRENEPKAVPQTEVGRVIAGNTKETGKTVNGIDVEQRAKIINQYIETGALSAADQTIILGELRTQLTKDPDISALLNALPARARDAFLNEMITPLLEDQKGREIVSRLFRETIDHTKIISRQQLLEAKKAADVAVEAANAIVPQLNEVRTQLPIKQARLTEFSDGSGGTTKGSAFTELEQAKKDIPANKAKLAVNQNQQQRLKARLNELNRELFNARRAGAGRATIAKIETDITSEESDLTNLTSEDAQLNEQIALPARLQTEWDQLKRDVPQLLAQHQQLDRQHKTLYKQWEESDAELKRAEGSHKDREEAFKREVAGVFKSAIRQLLEEKVQLHEAAQEEYIEELKKTARTDAERALLNAYMELWATGKIKNRGPFGLGGKTEVTLLDQQQTRQDFEILIRKNAGGLSELNPNGPKELIRAILTNPPYSNEEIDRLMQDEQFNKNTLPQVLEGLIARKMQADPKGLTPREAELILSAPWGDKVIDNALKKNPSVQAKIDELRAKGAITGTSAEWLRKQPKNLILALLLGIIGATAAFAFGPAFIGTVGAGVIGGAGAVPGGYALWDKYKG